MKTEKIRAYLLEKGDLFIRGFTPYAVRKIEDDLIHYQAYIKNYYGGACLTMSVHSREIILLVDEGKNKIFLEEATPKSEGLAESEP